MKLDNNEVNNHGDRHYRIRPITYVYNNKKVLGLNFRF